MDHMTDEEKKCSGVNCANFLCCFYDEFYEQNCSAGNEDGDQYIEECDKYIPE